MRFASATAILASGTFLASIASCTAPPEEFTSAAPPISSPATEIGGSSAMPTTTRSRTRSALPTTPRTTTTSSQRPPTSSTTTRRPTRSATSRPPDDDLPHGALRLPAHGEANASPAGRIANADIVTNADHTCVWIQDGPYKHAALWWPGYYAMFNPLRIFDKDGNELWIKGQLRDIGGGFTPYQIERIPPECRTGGKAWWMAPLEDG